MNSDERGVSVTKIAIASAVGCAIEWYDFFLYGIVSAIVFNRMFFPSNDETISTMLTWTTYATGFFSRPIGAIIFGHFGDRIGRKTVLILTLLIMGVATLAIGLLPSYETIGIWAPITLLVLRVLQGIGIGGEWGGAVLMSVEHSPHRNRGYYGAWPQIGVPAGMFLSTGCVFLITAMTSEREFAAFGWRIAFLFSAVLVVIGLYIRFNIYETPAFQKMKERREAVPVPFFELWRSHPKNVMLGMGARYIEGVCFNTYSVYLLSYLTSAVKLPQADVLAAITVASVIMIFLIPIYGGLSDRIGRRLQFGVAAISTGVLVFPAFAAFSGPMPMPWIWVAIILGFGIVYPALYAPQAALFSELFDTRVRYNGISFVYHFSGIFASGLTPIVMSWLLLIGGGRPWLICVYVAIVSLISTLSVALMTEGSGRDIQQDLWRSERRRTTEL